MSECAGPDCGHPSHDETKPPLNETEAPKSETPAPTPAVPAIEVDATCHKCGKVVSVPESAPNPLHGDGGCMGQLLKPGESFREGQRMIEAPDHIVFKPGEIFPMRGFNWRVLGYSKKWELVFECVGMTAAEAKRRNQKGKK